MGVNVEAPRFTLPILTVQDVAHLVGMPRDTAIAWAGQRKDRPQLFTRVEPYRRGWPSVPLIGLAEVASLRALKALLPAREVPVAARFITEQQKVEHPLAHRHLVTDGATVFLDERGDITRLRDGQGTIAQTFRDFLAPLVYEAGDDYPAAYDVPGMPGVQIHPLFNAGRMSFRHNRVPLFAVAALLAAGESPVTIRQEFGLGAEELQLVGDHMDWLEQAA